MNITFHYPPELMNLLIETIPLLCKSKRNTLLFFRGAGVEDELTKDLWETVQDNRDSITKYEIVRSVLTRLNERGESALRERREVLKRVVEFENYAGCWPQDQLNAKGLVAEIREVINVKDAFTRMDEERRRERQQHIDKKEEELRSKQKRTEAIGKLKDEFFSLFSELDATKRGKALESVLNKLFQVYEISVREAFTLTGDSGEGVVEQIDGTIEFGGYLYFVEMKWWKEPIGVPEISQHLVRIYHRPESRAIVISASNFTDPAVSMCKEALVKGKVITLCTLEELVMLLEQQGDLTDFLRRKVQSTIIDKNPFPRVEIHSTLKTGS